MRHSYPMDACLDILELSPDATYQDARKAYLAMIQRWHPDRFDQYPPLQSHAVRVTQEINAAFEILSKVLPHNQSMADRNFFESFEVGTAEWSDYFSSSPIAEAMAEFDVPESQFEPQPGVTCPRNYLGLLFDLLLFPLKCLIDFFIYFLFERPMVPAIAAFIWVISLY